MGTTYASLLLIFISSECTPRFLFSAMCADGGDCSLITWEDHVRAHPAYVTAALAASQVRQSIF